MLNEIEIGAVLIDCTNVSSSSSTGCNHKHSVLIGVPWDCVHFSHQILAYSFVTNCSCAFLPTKCSVTQSKRYFCLKNIDLKSSRMSL